MSLCCEDTNEDNFNDRRNTQYTIDSGSQFVNIEMSRNTVMIFFYLILHKSCVKNCSLSLSTAVFIVCSIIRRMLLLEWLGNVPDSTKEWKNVD